MEFKVRLFLGGEQIDPSDYSNVIITSPTVDRIVNAIYEEAMREEDEQEE